MPAKTFNNWIGQHQSDARWGLSPGDSFHGFAHYLDLTPISTDH